jgi:hypothetical protein
MRTKVAVLLMILAVVLVACGDADEPDATAVPTRFVPTATPRSTPLPPAATPVRLGTDAAPLPLVFVVDDPTPEQETAQNTLQEALNTGLDNERLTQLGLTMVIAVDIVETASEALAAVCGSDRALAWVDAFTYIAAAQECNAAPVFSVQRTPVLEHLPSELSYGSAMGVSFDVVVDATLDSVPTTLNDVAGLTLCRVNAQDTISWVYPALALQAAGLNPLTDLANVVEVDDYNAMLATIATSPEVGGCDVGAIPEGTLSDLVELAIEDDATFDEDAFATMRNTWPPVPHAILIAPADTVLPDDLLQAATTQLQTIATGDDAASLAELLPYDALQVVTTADLRTFTNWVGDTGWAMGR